MSKKFKSIDRIEEWINANIYYDPEFGIFLNTKSNKILLNTDLAGYSRVHINTNGINAHIKLHRIAWFLFYDKWPDKCIDHINGNKSDNRIENLRDVTPSENNLNSIKHRNGHVPLISNFQSKLARPNKTSIQIRKNNGLRSTYSYFCRLQAEMAACMALFGEFNPEIHNERVVNHLNSHGNLLKRNLKFSKTSKHYIVSLGCKQVYINSSYDKALSIWKSIYE